MSEEKEKKPPIPKLPVSYKEFKKDKASAFMYMLIVGIVALFGWLQVAQNQRNKSYEKDLKLLRVDLENERKAKIELTVRVDLFTERLRRSDSSLARANAILETFQKMGKLQ